ncbi:MAG: ribbon-helix-helix protein, CopG family [Microbacterium sp.]
MAMNLRLRDDAAAALRAESERTGLSQQEILRRAVDEHLGLVPFPKRNPWPDWVEPPSESFRDIEPILKPKAGEKPLSEVLIELREERLH